MLEVKLRSARAEEAQMGIRGIVFAAAMSLLWLGMVGYAVFSIIQHGF